MTQDTQTAPCPACQAANLPGVKFCGQCGSPLAAPAARVAPPSASPAAPIAAGSADAMARVHEALTRANAAVTGGDGQTTLTYQLAYTERMLGPMKLHYAGTVTSGAQGHAITARVLPQSLAIQFGSFVLGAVMLGFVPRTLMSNEMFFGLAAGVLGYTVWITFFEGPKRVCRHLEKLIAPSGNAAPVPTSMTSPSTAPSQPTAVSSTAPAGDVFAQLERLAQMQATGLLSAEEVASKKAELLQRI